MTARHLTVEIPKKKCNALLEKNENLREKMWESVISRHPCSGDQRTTVICSHPSPDTDKGAVSSIRKWLERNGVKP